MENKILREKAEWIIKFLPEKEAYYPKTLQELLCLQTTIRRLAKEWYIRKELGKTTWLQEFKFEGIKNGQYAIRRKTCTYEQNMEKIKRVMAQEPWDEARAKLWDENYERMLESKKNMVKPRKDHTKKDLEYWTSGIKYKKGRRGPYRHR